MHPSIRNLALVKKTSIRLSPPCLPPPHRKLTNPTLNTKCTVMAPLRGPRLVHKLLIIAFVSMHIYCYSRTGCTVAVSKTPPRRRMGRRRRVSESIQPASVAGNAAFQQVWLHTGADLACCRVVANCPSFPMLPSTASMAISIDAKRQPSVKARRRFICIHPAQNSAHKQTEAITRPRTQTARSRKAPTSMQPSSPPKRSLLPSATVPTSHQRKLTNCMLNC